MPLPRVALPLVLLAACSDETSTCRNGKRDHGELCLTMGSTVRLVGGPHAAAVADMDSDGDNDLTIVHAEGDNLSILDNDGKGGFSITRTLGVGDAPSGIAAADLDDDGDTDLVTVQARGDSLRVLRNQDGELSVAQAITVGKEPISVALGHLDNDSVPDMSVAERAGAQVRIISGVRTPSGYSVGTSQEIPFPSVRKVLVSDMNRDGLLDILVLTSSSVELLRNEGSGSFTRGAAFALEQPAADISVAAIDRNTDPCLVVAIPSVGIIVAKADGEGTLRTHLTLGPGSASASERPVALAVGDMNGDGKDDIVAANAASASVSIALAAPTGFRVHRLRGVPDPSEVLAAELNDDGALDVALMHENGVSVYLSSP
ncbi:MAG: VCBS repeat-containing protein [Deltaproteobacteria bacterium]|nr:VCBS repeat-containing protein [Deltaproteobacteria bacterium]